jgi:hypothetical protein
MKCFEALSCQLPRVRRRNKQYSSKPSRSRHVKTTNGRLKGIDGPRRPPTAARGRVGMRAGRPALQKCDWRSAACALGGARRAAAASCEGWLTRVVPRTDATAAHSRSPSPTYPFSSIPHMHPNDPGRCACLRFVRLRLPCPRCVYLLCERLLCMLSICAIAHYCTSLPCRVYACLCSSLTSPSCFLQPMPATRVHAVRARAVRVGVCWACGALVQRSSRSCGFRSSTSPTPRGCAAFV